MGMKAYVNNIRYSGLSIPIVERDPALKEAERLKKALEKRRKIEKFLSLSAQAHD
jgi:hypothetical protein